MEKYVNLIKSLSCKRRFDRVTIINNWKQDSDNWKGGGFLQEEICKLTQKKCNIEKTSDKICKQEIIHMAEKWKVIK